MPLPKDEKKSNGFPNAKFNAESFEEKFIKKIKSSRNSPDPGNSQCGHQQPCSLCSAFAYFQALQDNPGRFQVETLVATREKNSFLFRVDPYFVIITGEPVSAATSIALFR